MEAHGERWRQQSQPLSQLYREDLELDPALLALQLVNFSVNVHRMGMPGPV